MEYEDLTQDQINSLELAYQKKVDSGLIKTINDALCFKEGIIEAFKLHKNEND